MSFGAFVPVSPRVVAYTGQFGGYVPPRTLEEATVSPMIVRELQQGACDGHLTP